MWNTGETQAEGENDVDKRVLVHSVDEDPKYLENRKDVEREAQGAQGLNKNCRECAPFVASDQKFPPLGMISESGIKCLG